jgi:hypothetical protein
VPERWSTARRGSLTAVVGALTVAWAAPVGAAAPVAPPEVAVARAFTAAWNAQDVEGVLGLFAEAARVRQRGAQISQYGPDVQVDDVLGAALNYPGDPPPADGDAVVWAAGRAAVRAWVARFLAAGHRVVASNYRLAGGAVGWDYEVPPPAAWAAGVPGLAPARGVAEALVVDERIVTLTVASAPGTAEARRRALAAAAAAAVRREAAAGASAGPPRSPGPPAGAAPAVAPWGLAVLLSLATTAGLAALPATRRGPGRGATGSRSASAERGPARPPPGVGEP